MGDRGFGGMAGPLEREHGVQTVIRYDPDRLKGEFRPLQPLWKVEAAFSKLGRWRRLARGIGGNCCVGGGLEVAAVGWLLRELG